MNSKQQLKNLFIETFVKGNQSSKNKYLKQDLLLKVVDVKDKFVIVSDGFNSIRAFQQLQKNQKLMKNFIYIIKDCEMICEDDEDDNLLLNLRYSDFYEIMQDINQINQQQKIADLNLDITKEEKEIIIRKRLKKKVLEQRQKNEFDFGLNHFLEIKRMKKSSTTPQVYLI